MGFKKYIRTHKVKVIVLVAVIYFAAGFMNYLSKSVKLMSCGVKLKGVGTHLKRFENINGRLPFTLVELGELAKTDDEAMTLDDIYCDAAKNDGYEAYIYSPKLTACDPNRCIIMYDSKARHYSAASTGFWKSVLLFYYGSEKMRNVLYYDGYVENFTETEFQGKMNAQAASGGSL